MHAADMRVAWLVDRFERNPSAMRYYNLIALPVVFLLFAFDVVFIHEHHSRRYASGRIQGSARCGFSVFPYKTRRSDLHFNGMAAIFIIFPDNTSLLKGA